MEKHTKREQAGMVAGIISLMIDTMREAKAPVSGHQKQIMREILTPALDRILGELYDGVEKNEKDIYDLNLHFLNMVGANNGLH